MAAAGFISRYLNGPIPNVHIHRINKREGERKKGRSSGGGGGGIEGSKDI